jgi:hypothetical protein
MWTMLGPASKAAHKSHHTEVLLCEVHIALLLLTMPLPPTEHANCFVVSVAIFNTLAAECNSRNPEHSK